MTVLSSGDMLLAQHLLNSSNIFLNVANLSVRHRSCRVLASLKDILAFMKTRRLKLILAENIGWPTSTLKSRFSFRNFFSSKSLEYKIPKKAGSSSFIITTYFFRQLFNQCHNFLSSVIQNRCNHVICKKVCPCINGLFFVAHSLLWSKV